MEDLTLQEAKDLMENATRVYPGPRFESAIGTGSQVEGSAAQYAESQAIVKEYADAIGLTQVNTYVAGFVVSLELEQLVTDGSGCTVEGVVNPLALIDESIPNPGHQKLLATYPKAAFPGQ